MLSDIRNLSQNFLKHKNIPYRRYFIESEPFKHRLSLVLGQRGVGKTTTLIQYLLDQVSNDLFDPSILYVQVDHFQVNGIPIYEIAEQFYTMGGKIIAFDEIHKYPNWSQELKSIYDTFPKLKVIVSGSSALQMHKGSHDLSRRAIKYQLYGLSFREFLELSLKEKFNIYTLEDILKRHQEIAVEVIDRCEKFHKKINPLFQDYLRYGYYPYFLEINDEALYLITLEQNVHTTIESDLAAIYPHLSGASINKIKQILTFIAKSVPFIPNWNNIKDAMDIGDIRTLKNYFLYLEDAYLIRIIKKNNERLRHLSSSEKVYLDNPNQMYALSLESPNSGTIRESFFLNALSPVHKITLPSNGDFLIDNRYCFEVGGKNKKFEQIKNEPNSFLACDSIELGIGNKIPLWLFGFLY